MLKSVSIFVILLWLSTPFSQAFTNELPEKAPRPDWVTPLDVNYQAETIPGSISDGVHYLMVNHQKKYTDDQSYFYTQMVKKVVNESGLSDSSTIEITFDPTYQKLIFHDIIIWRNGVVIDRLDLSEIKILHREESLDRQIYDGSLTATLLLTDVRVADVVGYSYSRVGQNPVFDNGAYDSFNLGYSPIVDRRYMRILMPQDRTVALKAHNRAPDPVITLEGDMRQYVWDIAQTKGHNIDDDVPGWLSSLPWTEISESDSWQEVAQWDIKNYLQPEVLSSEIQKAITHIATTHTTAKDRYRAILDYTQKEIRYLGIELGQGSYIPRDPSLTVANRYGDCKDKTYLFITMARAMGLPASAVMVHSGKGEYLPERLPSPSLFNHVIVHLNLDGKDYWLDPTLAPQGGDLDHLYQPDYGHALIIEPETTALTRMTPVDTFDELRMVEEELDLRAGYDQPVTYSVKATYRSWHADDMRDYFANNALNKITKDYLNYFAKTYPEIATLEPITFEDDEVNNVFITYEKYALENPWVPDEENGTVELHFDNYEIDGAISKTGTPFRSMPLKISFPVKVRQKITVQFPDEWNIDNDHFAVENIAFKYSLTETYKNKIYTLDYRYESLTASIPASSAGQYNKNIDEIWRQGNNYIYMDDPNGEATASVEETGLVAFLSGLSDEDYDTIGNIVLLVVAIFLFGWLVLLILYFRNQFSKRVTLKTPYYPVALSKFILMSLTTFGVYTIFWFYANWKYIQLQKNSAIWPLWRAIFSMFTFFFLIKKFNNDPGTNKGLNIYFAALLGLGYFIFEFLASYVDNEALALATGTLATLFLIPFVIRINANVETYEAQYVENSRYRLSSYMGLSLGGSLVTLMLLSGINYIPFGQTMYGDKIWQTDIAYLQDKGFLSEDEKLGFLATDDFFTIKDNGYLFTDKKILTYWSDENSGKINTETLLLMDIRKAKLEDSRDYGWMDLTVTLKDDKEHVFELPDEDDMGLEVLSFIQALINNTPEVQVTFTED